VVKTAILGWLMGVMLSACAMAVQEPPVVPASVSASTYVLELRFSSDVPNDYYVFSGPAESYDRFRVNDRLRAALEEYGRRKSGSAGTQTAEVRVHLISVKTRYHQLGASLRPGRLPRVALADFRMRQEDLSIPREITKEVDLTASVEVVEGGRTLRKETFTVTTSETIERDYYDRWAYDYSGVIRGALRRAIEAVDRVVTEALAGSLKAWGPSAKQAAQVQAMRRPQPLGCTTFHAVLVNRWPAVG
jgi:hypothetical protein